MNGFAIPGSLRNRIKVARVPPPPMPLAEALDTIEALKLVMETGVPQSEFTDAMRELFDHAGPAIASLGGVRSEE